MADQIYESAHRNSAIDLEAEVTADIAQGFAEIESHRNQFAIPLESEASDGLTAFDEVDKDWYNQEIFQRLHAQDEATHVIDALRKVSRDELSAGDLDILLSPPDEVLAELGCRGTATLTPGEQWLERLELKARAVGALPGGVSLQEIFKDRIQNASMSEGDRSALLKVIDKGFSVAGDSSISPENSAIRLLEMYYSPDMDPTEREAEIQKIQDGVDISTRRDMARELRRLEGMTDVLANDLKEEFVAEEPDLDKIYHALLGRSKSELVVLEGKLKRVSADDSSIEERINELDVPQEVKDDLLHLNEGFDSDGLEKKLREEILEIKSKWSAFRDGGFIQSIWDAVKFGEGNTYNDDGKDYVRLGRLMRGLSPEQMQEVTGHYEGAATRDMLKESSQDFAGFVDSHQADIDAVLADFNAVTDPSATPDEVRAQLKPIAEEVIRVLVADAVTPAQATQRLKQIFNRLDPDQAAVLRDQVKEIRRAQLTTEEERVKLDADGNPVIDPASGDPVKEIVQILDTEQPGTIADMVNHRYQQGEELSEAGLALSGFDVKRHVSRVIGSLSEGRPEDIAARDRLLERALYGLSPEQIALVETEFKKQIEYRSRLVDDVTDVVYANHESEYRLYTAGTRESWTASPQNSAVVFDTPLGNPSTGAIRAQELGVALNKAVHSGDLNTDSGRAIARANVIRELQGLDDSEMSVALLSGEIFAGVSKTKLEIALDNQKGSATEAARLGFNPWQRVEKLRTEVPKLNDPDDAVKAAAKASIETIFDGVAAGNDAAAYAARVALLREVYRAQIGRELENELNAAGVDW